MGRCDHSMVQEDCDSCKEYLARLEKSTWIAPGRIPTDPENSVLTEAHGLVHGERNADYDHPYTDYSRSVAIFKAWTGIELTPSQGIKFMRCVKMSREISNPNKRDNYTDGAGYIECDRIVVAEEQARAPWTGVITVEGVPVGDQRAAAVVAQFLVDRGDILYAIRKLDEEGFSSHQIAIAMKMPQHEVVAFLNGNDGRKIADGNTDEGSATQRS